MSDVGKSLRALDWARDVPQNWADEWLKWNVTRISERPTAEESANLPYIANEDIEAWTGRLLVDDPSSSEDAQSRKFLAGDILLNKLRPYLAKVLHAQFDGVSSGELLCLRPSQAVLPRYLFYVVSSKGFIDAMDAETFGSKMPRADWEIVGHQPLPLPPKSTQLEIATFLDKKTARIDALIEHKRALLDRLAEKRQALITEAVTKGLNADAPMKHSGIDWLGDIPAHWKVTPVKRVAKLESGHTPNKKIDRYWENCTIPWVSLNDTATLRQNDYISATAFQINDQGLANSSARLLPSRAVVFTRDATIGESAITTCPMAVSQHLIAWLCDEERVLPEFLLTVIYGMTGELNKLTNGSTIGTIGLADVKAIRVALPPIEEQRDIVGFVFSAKARLVDVAGKVSTSIERLREYRNAIIASAVTGQVLQ